MKKLESRGMEFYIENWQDTPKQETIDKAANFLSWYTYYYNSMEQLCTWDLLDRQSLDFLIQQVELCLEQKHFIPICSNNIIGTTRKDFKVLLKLLREHLFKNELRKTKLQKLNNL